MRLLIGSSAPCDGGQGISAYARTLSSTLAKAGHEIHSASPAPRDRSFLETLGIGLLVTDPAASAAEVAAEVLRYMRAHRIEGIINNDNAALQNIAPASPVPFVAICHMDRCSVATLCTHHREWVDHLVCISNDMRHAMVTRYGFPNTNCRIIHNGVGDPGHGGDFAPRSPGRLRLVCVGGMSPEKGGPKILRAIERDPALWESIELDWFGSVPEKVQARVAALPGVRFRGQVPQADFHETLAAADVLAFPSVKEGCPMTALEAMSFGVLPIMTDGVGAMRWLIDSGREGFICDISDWQRQFTDCLRYLLHRPDAVADMKRAARARFIASFQSEDNARAILDLVRRPTVDRSSPPRRFGLVAWHRPPRKLSLVERIRYRMGWLESAGEFDLDALEREATGV